MRREVAVGVESATFNLSQFNNAAQLKRGFYKTQAIASQGKLPLILWDEFDATFQGVQFGWLPEFLMPMQDGKFRDDDDLPLGDCVFVFIGGRMESAERFSLWATGDATASHAADPGAFKARDFHSRLESTFTVPSATVPFDDANPTEVEKCVMNRAMILRHQLRKLLRTKLDARAKSEDNPILRTVRT